MTALFRRNIKMFFRDKGMFFVSLITPMILLVLYVSFLGNVYRDAFRSAIPGVFSVPDDVMNGLVGGQLVSSMLSVSCVTVSFCANLLMVQDKANGTLRDLTIAPVRGGVLAAAYFAATWASALMICMAALGVCLAYLAATGWYLTAMDTAMLACDVLLMTLFGTAWSSVISSFLSTQGQMSAVGTIVSSTYGFLSGAYMPISQFGEGLQNVIACLPGTYGTVLMRRHAMGGAIAALGELGVPEAALDLMRDSVDCNLYLFGTRVPDVWLWAVPVIVTAALTAAYVLIHTKQKTA